MDFAQLTPWEQYGINPGSPTATSHGGGGQTLPSVDTAFGDNAMIPWHPDSPVFWAVVLGVATIAGIIGASVDVRAGKRHASVKVGD
jgi:hypothetical protein